LVVLLSAVLASPHWDHVQDFPGAPPLNSSSDRFAALQQNMSLYYDKLYAASKSWSAYRHTDGISFTTADDPDGGCPWLYATAELSNCTLENSAQFIITKLEQYQHIWDQKLDKVLPQRYINISNGSLSIEWLEYNTGPFLSVRGYYNFGAWQWQDRTITSSTASVYSTLTAPAGASQGTVRMAGRQWKRLTKSGSTSTQYEVLQLSDIEGFVPCSITLSGQADVLHDEIQAYRQNIPNMK